VTATTNKPTVLVVDDDKGVRGLCEAALQGDYEVITAEDGQSGLRSLYARKPDIVLLDVTMPKMNGIEVCRRIREITDTPVIMLTAHGSEQDVARGLDAGADDYVVKPFRPVELAARIRAALRRHQRDGSDAGESELLSFQGGDLIVDAGRRLAIVQGKEVALSAIEYKLLEALARNAGRVLTHDQILDKVWGYEYAGETNYVKTYVGLIRNKIEAEPGKPRFIVSRRGLGYYLEPRRVGRLGTETE
jgi:DNA-binding response OmpR family regulator